MYRKCPFPSPRGDKLQHKYSKRLALRRQSFRPLAGISCNAPRPCPRARRLTFPSPRGDKLQHGDALWDFEIKFEFPSPRGDKLQQGELANDSKV